jgi:hypothetical protein
VTGYGVKPPMRGLESYPMSERRERADYLRGRIKELEDEVARLARELHELLTNREESPNE